ncbi:hypothetical protein ACIHCM_13690 [Streptomyces sp. NPDC052023]|uniref:hypothetical protein n=1 Tax=Streptomyces sp. NPDC052023 TaxID=3365681 RepID=UPI0037D06B57
MLRGDVLLEQAGLVEAFEAAAPLSDAASAVDWLEIGRRVRREGCCDVEGDL